MVTLVVHPRKKRDPAADHDLGFKVKVSGKLKLQQKFLQEPEPYCSCLLTRHQVCIIRMLQRDRRTHRGKRAPEQHSMESQQGEVSRQEYKDSLNRGKQKIL